MTIHNWFVWFVTTLCCLCGYVHKNDWRHALYAGTAFLVWWLSLKLIFIGLSYSKGK